MGIEGQDDGLHDPSSALAVKAFLRERTLTISLFSLSPSLSLWLL